MFFLPLLLYINKLFSCFFFVCFFKYVVTVPGEVFTSWPISIAHNLADWSLASTMTLNMVHNVGEIRKSVDLLLFASLDSNAILVLQCKLNTYTQYGRKHFRKLNLSILCHKVSSPCVPKHTQEHTV